MSRQKRSLLAIIACVCSLFASAQTNKENTAWLAWLNSYRFSKNWAVHFDGQLRSGDDWNYMRTVLIRPGITYYFNAKNTVTVGYAYVGTQTRLAPPSKNTLTENRIWEQYLYTAKFNQVSLQNRLRLEQRFIEQQTRNVFAQRLRYFVRTIIPLQKQKSSFNEGVFAAIQNELFFNIQNKNATNNSFFDQNRAYGAIGYRFSSKVDLEAGYMNQYTNGATTDVSNNIIQLALYTRF